MPEERVPERVDEAVALREQVRTEVVAERVAADGFVAPVQEQVADTEREREHGDRSQAERESRASYAPRRRVSLTIRLATPVPVAVSTRPTPRRTRPRRAPASSRRPAARYRVIPNVVAAVNVIVPAIARNGRIGTLRRRSRTMPAIANGSIRKYWSVASCDCQSPRPSSWASNLMPSVIRDGVQTPHIRATRAAVTIA